MAAVVARLPEEWSAPWPAVAEAGVAALTQLVTAVDDSAHSGDEDTDEDQVRKSVPEDSMTKQRAVSFMSAGAGWRNASGLIVPK